MLPDSLVLAALLENLALRQQLTTLKRKQRRPRVVILEKFVLGALAARLARVEAGADFCPTGDSCLLAQGWIQVVLGVAFAASNSDGQEVRQH